MAAESVSAWRNALVKSGIRSDDSMRMPRTVGNFSEEELIIPTILRDRDQRAKQFSHAPGREEFIFEEEEIELPTFIRKQAN